ncbi:hypothetical protein HanIR_Chr04g0191141 [Helianthus annuus]|nr:hypothetical protein HanIR_Chr04g0191141 [Helianthus annuus]
MKSIDLSFSLISIRFPSCFFGQSIIGWNHYFSSYFLWFKFDTYQWYQSGLDPLMDAHEWNESLDRIISTIAEMIDLLKHESRRWATSPIFSTPLPSPAAASPPPTSAPVPTLPPPVSATAPTTPRPIPMNLHHQVDSPMTHYDPQKPKLHIPRGNEKDDHMPKQTIILSPTSYGSDTGPPQTNHYKDHFYVHNEAPIAYSAGKREWRPPWRPVETTLNATHRTEWRPPWSLSSVLEDKDVFNGAGMIRAHDLHAMFRCNSIIFLISCLVVS